MKLFLQKNAKVSNAGAPPPGPRASGGWELCLQTPSLRRLGASPPDHQNSPPLRISGYAPASNKRFSSFIETKKGTIAIKQYKLFSRRSISSRFLRSILDPDKNELLTVLFLTKCLKFLRFLFRVRFVLKTVGLLFFDNSQLLFIRTF